jgi:hypothetical protein
MEFKKIKVCCSQSSYSMRIHLTLTSCRCGGFANKQCGAGLEPKCAAGDRTCSDMDVAQHVPADEEAAAMEKERLAVDKVRTNGTRVENVGSTSCTTSLYIATVCRLAGCIVFTLVFAVAG